MSGLVACELAAEESTAKEKQDSTSQQATAKANTKASTNESTKESKEKSTKNKKDAASELLNTILAHNAELKKSLDLAVENHRAAIEQKENEVGPYDLELSEMVFGLGKTLQTSQRYDEAINAYRRSLYLKRVNNGVYSLSQAPMLRGIIESHVKQGQTDAAAENYEQLVWIHLKTYGNNDPRLIPLMEEVAQWHLNTYIQTEKQKGIYHLNAAFELYSIAIKLSSEHQGELNVGLISMLKNLAITSYYQTRHQQRYPEFAELGSPVPFGYHPLGTSGDERLRRGSYYLHGHAAHRKILEILASNPEVTPIDRAKAHTDLGDWYILYGRYQLAVKAYEQAHKALEGDEQKEQVIAYLFGSPIMLPKLESKIIQQTAISSKVLFNRPLNQLPVSSLPSPKLSPSQQAAENSADKQNTEHTAEQTIFFQENYVNLTVDVTKKGSATNLKVSDTPGKNAGNYAGRAKQTIRAKKFRPRFEAGIPVLTSEFPVRVLISNENS